MIALQTVLVAAMLSTSPAAAPVATTVPSDSIRAALLPADTIPRRRHAIEYSDWYEKRLTIHRIGSYTMLPLFGAEYVLGNQLMHGDESYKSAHVVVATGIGALFTVNTVTGAWNWWDSRSDPAGRTRRTLHVLTMLASDAGLSCGPAPSPATRSIRTTTRVVIATSRSVRSASRRSERQ